MPSFSFILIITFILQRIRVFTMANLHPVVGYHDEEEEQLDEKEESTEDSVVQLCIKLCYTMIYSY